MNFSTAFCAAFIALFFVRFIARWVFFDPIELLASILTAAPAAIDATTPVIIEEVFIFITTFHILLCLVF